MKNLRDRVTLQATGRRNTSTTVSTQNANIKKSIKYHITNKQFVRIEIFTPGTVGYSDTRRPASTFDVSSDRIETKDTCSRFDRMKPDCREFLQAELAAGLIR